MVRFTVSRKLLFISNEDNRALSINGEKIVHPYPDYKEREIKVDDSRKAYTSIKVESNSCLKFNRYLKDDNKQQEASKALVEYVRMKHLEKAMKSESPVLFYVPSGFDLDVDYNLEGDPIGIPIFDDLIKNGIDIECVNGEKFNQENRVVQFYGKEHVACYRVNNVKDFSFVQKALFTALYYQLTRLVSHIRPVYNTFSSYKVQKSKTEPNMRYTKAKRELEQAYYDGILAGSQTLYEQLYFDIEDFVVL